MTTEQSNQWWRKCCTVEHWLSIRHLPDACTNEQHEAFVLQQRRSERSAADTTATIQSRMYRFFVRERNLVVVAIVLVLLLNFQFGRFLLYPFRLFTTWVHELCHGLAATLSGGRVTKLQIFRDGSGLAFSRTYSNFSAAFTSSGGYPGTAVTGFLLLLFRRTTLGPTFGTIGLGVAIVLSVVILVRNVFGVVMLTIEGFVLIVLGWKLPAVAVDNLFTLLAVTCCLNAFEDIRNLFSSGTFMVGGQVRDNSDAHSVAERWGGDFRLWAFMWILLSVLLTGLGLWLSLDGRPIPAWIKQKSGSAGTTSAAVEMGTTGAPTIQANTGINNTPSTRPDLAV